MSEEYDLLNTTTLKELKGIVAETRKDAIFEARQQGKWIRSRGTYLTTSNEQGQCYPRPAAECPEWDGTLKSIAELTDIVRREYPAVTRVMLEGGYDCADTFEQLYKNDDYLPQASWWQILIWKRSEK